MSTVLPVRTFPRGRVEYRCVLAVADTDTRNTLATHLELEGWSVVNASDGFCALRHGRDNMDLMILDLRIPGADGLTVIRTLRREGFELPILAIARDENEMVLGLELGADGFVPQPISPTLLLSQVRALQRRSARLLGAQSETTVYLDYGRLVVDEAARVARVDDTALALRPREFAILLALARNPGVALSRAKLVERVWGEDFPGEERTVDSHIRRIRAQLERFPGVAPWLQTVHGFGYKFEPPA